MSMRNPRKDESKEDPMRWLLTYADMITLLMLFFIILTAMSNPNKAKYEQLQQVLGSVFTGGNLTLFVTRGAGGAGVLEGLTPGQNVQSKATGKNSGVGGRTMLRNQAVSTLQNLVKAGKVTVIPTENGFAISLVSDLYFGSGSAALNPDAMPVLQEVTDFLGQIANSVVVEGHTDNIPPDLKQWSSNWHLSSGRALAVLQTLQDYGIPSERLSEAAYGDTRPVQSNDTPEGRSYNRRVDIVVVDQQ